MPSQGVEKHHACPPPAHSLPRMSTRAHTPLPPTSPPGPAAGCRHLPRPPSQPPPCSRRCCSQSRSRSRHPPQHPARASGSLQAAALSSQCQGRVRCRRAPIASGTACLRVRGGGGMPANGDDSNYDVGSGSVLGCSSCWCWKQLWLRWVWRRRAVAQHALGITSPALRHRCEPNAPGR